MLRVIGLLYFILTSSIHALECGVNESWDIRLDQANGPFSDGKVYNQGSTGTCYAQSLALNLKAQLKNKQDISAFHLAAFKADSPTTLFESLFSGSSNQHTSLNKNELTSKIDAGEFCETFNYAKKMQGNGICPQLKSTLENSFSFLSSETASADIAQLSLFFDELSGKDLNKSDLKNRLTEYLNPLFDTSICGERKFGQDIPISRLLIYVREYFNRKYKTDDEKKQKYKELFNKLSIDFFNKKFEAKQLNEVNSAYVFDKLVELNIITKDELNKDGFISEFDSLLSVYKLTKDTGCRKEKSKERIASIENRDCFKGFGVESASIAKTVGALDNLYQNVGKVILHLDFENKKFPDYFMSLISECTKNDRVSIPEDLKCERIKFENKKKDREEFRKTILNRITRGQPVDVNYCTKFYKEPDFKLRNVNEALDLNKCNTNDRHSLHASAVVGFKCKKGKAHYLVQNSWGKEWPWDSNIKFQDDSSDKSTGKVWVDEETMLGNLIQYNYLYSN